MKKIISMILASVMVLSLCSCQGGNQSESFTTTTAPVDTRPEAPNFVGLSLEQIEMRYPDLTLDPTYKYSDEYAKNVVMEQEIEAGDRYDEDTIFKVVVSSGSKLIEIDDYTDRNIDDVKTLLDKQGFVCDIIYAEDSTVTKNCVIKTVPAAREKAEAGTVVTCYVSLGAATVMSVVPEMTGLTIEQATELAKENNIKLTITYDESSESADAEPGTVIAQSIDPETEVEPETRVVVTIAGETSASSSSTTINVTLKDKVAGEFQLKYYIDGTLQEEKTEIKELSLTRKISWEVSGTDVHTFTIIVTSLKTGKSGTLYEMEVDFTQDPPAKDHHDTFNANIFSELLQ